jgi:cytochrome c
MLVSGADDGTVRVWSLQTGKEVVAFSGQGKVSGVAISPDGRLAASAGEDGTVRIWKLPDAK